jgi:primase-polymerase (primpol)-like protein
MRHLDLTHPKTRHVDLTRPAKTYKNKYEKYKDNYERYENTNERKEYMKEYNKAYRTEHEVYVQCECGSEVKSISMYAHVRTQKHIAYLQNVVS